MDIRKQLENGALDGTATPVGGLEFFERDVNLVVGNEVALIEIVSQMCNLDS